MHKIVKNNISDTHSLGAHKRYDYQEIQQHRKAINTHFMDRSKRLLKCFGFDNASAFWQAAVSLLILRTKTKILSVRNCCAWNRNTMNSSANMYLLSKTTIFVYRLSPRRFELQNRSQMIENIFWNLSRWIPRYVQLTDTGMCSGVHASRSQQ